MQNGEHDAAAAHEEQDDEEAAPSRWREITEEVAIEIFRTKAHRTSSDSARLAQQYGITAKAVRDIWIMRTWVCTTMPFWNRDDEREFLRSGRFSSKRTMS